MSQASDREASKAAFLERAGWGTAERAPLAGDASTRSYERVRKGDDRAVLMDAPPAAETPGCPPEADHAARAELGYNAQARLAGGSMAAFAGLARELKARGFSAPDIIAADFDNGFLLLEDLGDALFARAIEAGEAEQPLYEAAVDLLAALRRSSLPAQVSAEGRIWPVLGYDAVALQAEADLFLDWYVARLLDEKLEEAARADWRALWAPLLEELAEEPAALNLRDYHAENLIWLPERDGPARAGLLDFQDALFGHPAYDLVSLLEDARRDVAPALAEAMKERYAHAAYVADQAAFERAYAILGAQRNAKILGIFVRLAKRDGKARYLDLLPRVEGHFANDLSHPALADLRGWVRRYAPALTREERA